MPFIDVHVHPTLATDQAERIAAGVTLAMAEGLGKRREVTAVCVRAVADAWWTIDASVPDQPTAYVDVKITAGTNTAEQKAALLARLHALLVETLGALAEASYIVVHELPASDWGYGGKTQAARIASRA